MSKKVEFKAEFDSADLTADYQVEFFNIGKKLNHHAPCRHAATLALMILFPSYHTL